MAGEDRRSRALQFVLQICATVLRRDSQMLLCPSVRAEPEGDFLLPLLRLMRSNLKLLEGY